jgi:hypothetical protein
MFHHQCMPSSNSTCIIPDEAAVKTIDPASFIGDWFVFKGLSKAYDCYDCQRMAIRESTGPIPSLPDAPYYYNYTMQVRGELFVSVNCTVTPPSMDTVPTGPRPFIVDYFTHGVPGEDKWFVLYTSGDRSYMLIYYCGSTPSWSYTGAVAITKRPTEVVPSSVISEMEAALTKANVKLSLREDFCSPNISSCPYYPPTGKKGEAVQ